MIHTNYGTLFESLAELDAPDLPDNDEIKALVKAAFPLAEGAYKAIGAFNFTDGSIGLCVVYDNAWIDISSSEDKWNVPFAYVGGLRWIDDPFVFIMPAGNSFDEALRNIQTNTSLEVKWRGRLSQLTW